MPLPVLTAVGPFSTCGHRRASQRPITLLAPLNVIHNANETACERARSPKRQGNWHTGRERETDREKERVSSNTHTHTLLSLFMSCSTSTFLLGQHMACLDGSSEWHTCPSLCCYNRQWFALAALLSFSILIEWWACEREGRRV